MIALGVYRHGSVAKQLCAEPPDYLLLANRISRQRLVGSASRSL
jgi:hypothetical protein